MEQESEAMEAGNPSKRIRLDSNESIHDFGNPSQTDLVLEVEDKNIHVSKLVLSLASPVFDKMFQSDFKEGTCNVLPLSGKDVESMLEFLRCIYPNTLSPITHENALSILPLVEEYQVLHLKPRCEQALISSIDDHTSAAELFKLLQQAHTYELTNLRQKCVEHASKKTRVEIEDARKQEQPHAEDMVKILDQVSARLESKIYQLEAPVEVSRAAVAWSADVSPVDMLDIPVVDLDLVAQCLGTQVKLSELLALGKCLQWTGKLAVCRMCKIPGTCSDMEPRTQIVVGNTSMVVKITSNKRVLQAELTASSTSNTNEMCFIYVVYAIPIIINGVKHCNTVQAMQKYDLSKQNMTITKHLINVADGQQGMSESVLAFIFVSEPIKTST